MYNIRILCIFIYLHHYYLRYICPYFGAPLLTGRGLRCLSALYVADAGFERCGEHIMNINSPFRCLPLYLNVYLSLLYFILYICTYIYYFKYSVAEQHLHLRVHTGPQSHSRAPACRRHHTLRLVRGEALQTDHHIGSPSLCAFRCFQSRRTK